MIAYYIKEKYMNIYIDESGSINNHFSNKKHFVIAMVHVINKKGLDKAYKRFVASNIDRLKELDQEKIDPKTGKILKQGGKMFVNGKFKELKGAQFDKEMKQKFVEFFSKKHYFDVYYIEIINEKLTDKFCGNKARVFNYSIKLALSYFFKKGFLPNEVCILQLDERNEKTEAKYFLENYLNTELTLTGLYSEEFEVTYFDSSNNKFIQIADVFANLFYSHLMTDSYHDEFKQLEKSGIVKFIFKFPK